MSNSLSSGSGLLRNRFVQVIMISGVLLQIGIWVRNFAILLFVMEKTKNDPFAVSMISVAEFVPIFIFSFIGGTYADRWRPKITMVWCDLLSSISVLIVLLAIIFGTWQAVFFVTFISAILSQFSQPSSMKLFKTHVSEENLQAGMTMFQTLMAIFMIIGPMMGTFVYQKFGIHIAIGLTAILFLLSATVLTFLPADKKEENTELEANFWRELSDGFLYVKKRKALTILGGVFALAGFAVGIAQPLYIFIVIERLGLPKENLQWLLATNGAAMLIGGGILLRLSQKISPQKLLALGMFINGLSIIGIGISTNLFITLALEFFNGLFMPCIHIGINTLILQLSEEEFVGRVNGFLTPLFIGAMVITMSLAGWLKLQFSLVTMYTVSGVFFILGMLLTAKLFNKSYTNAKV